MRSVRLLAVATLLLPTLAQAQAYSTYYGAPTSGVTRASFVQMVMTQIGNPTDGTHCFTDVTNQSFASSVCAAKQRGIVTGDANGTFRPNDAISFIEATAVALRANGASVSYSNPWYASYLTTLSEWNAFPASVTNILYPINSSQAQDLISSVFSADHSSHSNSNNNSHSNNNSSSSDNNNNDDIKLTVTGSDSKADTGDTVTYTIKVKNEDNHDLHNVKVKAFLDSDFDFISTSKGGDYDDDQVEWEIDIDEDETETISLKLRVSGSADDNDKLRLRIRADDSEVRKTLTVDEGNSNSSSNNGDDLRISITDSPSTVEAGDTVTYTIKLENRDNEDMTVDVNAMLDQDMDFISASDGGDEDDNEVKWNNIFIGEDDEEEITVKVRVDSSVDDGDTVRLEVRAEGEEDSETTEINDRNNSGSDDISIAISDSSDPANPGETVTYTITLKNNMNDDEEFDVYADLDNDMSFLSASDGGDLDGHRVKWNNFEIDDDDKKVIYLRVQINNDVDDGDTLKIRVTAGDDDEEETTRID